MSNHAASSDSPKVEPAHDATKTLKRSELRAIDKAIAEEFPLRAPMMDLVLIDIDPTRLQAFWRLDAQKVAQERSRFSTPNHSEHFVLRVRELGDPSQGNDRGFLHTFDYPLDEGQNDAEIQVPPAHSVRSFEAELGFTAEDGGWLSLSLSNRIRLPSSQPDIHLSSRMLDVTPAPTAQSGRADVLENDEKAQAAAVSDSEKNSDASLRGGPADPLEPNFPNPLPSDARPLPEWRELPVILCKAPPQPQRRGLSTPQANADLPSSTGLFKRRPALPPKKAFSLSKINLPSLNETCGRR
jgi:hypothetical protein